MAEILLIQPRCGDWDLMGIRSPTGLLNVASVPVSKGYNIALVDQRISKDWREEIKRQLADAKICGITIMAGKQIKYALEISEFIRSVKADVLIVLGGTWAQTKPDLCIKSEYIDVVCYGEGDFLLPELRLYINGKKKIQDILGIYYKKDGEIIKNAPAELIKDLDQLPKIPYKLIDPKNYTAVGFNPGKPSISLILSRGCPFRCSFCSVSRFFNRKWRGYSVKRILEDLRFLEDEYGIKDFYFNDDNIAGNLKFFSELVKALAKLNRGYSWGTSGIRADTIIRLDDETLENIVKSGCKNLDVGVESGNPRILKFINKDESLETIRKANTMLSRYPIIIKYSFMGGFPTETPKEFLDTIKFKRLLEKENPHAVGLIFFYTPFPATDLFDLAVKKGLKTPRTLKEWADFNYNTWYKEYPSWLSRRMISLVERSVFLSYFENKNLDYKYPSRLMKFIFQLYHPIAKFRSDKHFFSMFIERRLAELLINIMKR
jgi:anaerobic magnesium-protoporphyrin IX monomethyl ester cyclase